MRRAVARAVRGAAPVLACAGMLHCSAPARREVAALEDSVDAYRKADTRAKQSKADAVSILPCSVAAICAARDACVSAMTPTTRGLLLKDEVARGLAELERKRLTPDSAEARALPGKLDEAAALLTTGRDKMADCDQSLAALRAHVAN